MSCSKEMFLDTYSKRLDSKIRETDRQANTDRQTDRQRDRQTDRQTERLRVTQTSILP